LLTLSTDGHEFDSLAGDEVQRLVHVGNLVEPHFAAVGFRKGLSRDHLQEEHQFQPIPEVLFDVLDGGAGFAEVRVAPRGECLQQDNAN